MPAKNQTWIYLVLLSLVWGSSFILIKGLIGLSPIQVGSFRIIFAAIFLMGVGFRTLLKLSSRQWKWIILSGFVGSFFPCISFLLLKLKLTAR